MKTDPAWITGAAFSVVVALANLICGIFVMLVPDATLGFLNEWTHGIDLTAIKRSTSQSMTFYEWTSGLLTISLTAFVAGTVFGWVRNALRRIAKVNV